MPNGKIDRGKRISLPEQSMCLNTSLVRPDLEVMIQTRANLLDTKSNETAACVSATSSLWVLFNTHNMHP
jgi:hypothetical protein